MQKAERILRISLAEVDDEIFQQGWDRCNPLLHMYRTWLIKSIQFIQLKYFDRT